MFVFAIIAIALSIYMAPVVGVVKVNRQERGALAAFICTAHARLSLPG